MRYRIPKIGSVMNAVEVSVKLRQDGKTIECALKPEGIAKKFVPKEGFFFAEYCKNVSDCPPAILVIPVLSNLLPAAWLGGFDILVDEIDSKFFESMAAARLIWAEKHKIKKPGLIIPKKITHLPSRALTKKAMLYSGGLDAAITLLRHEHTKPLLILIHGADIKLDNHSDWEVALGHAQKNAHQKKLHLVTIKSNFREFLWFEIMERKIVSRTWWGRVQHGMGLLGLCAPLSWTDEIGEIFIASSFKNFDGDWGSTQRTDEFMMWENSFCTHDAGEYGRQEKADIFARQLSPERLPLRVCWELSGSNCGRCEKCLRTAINLALAGIDPASVDVPFSQDTYPKVIMMLHGSKPKRGLLEYWAEIEAKAATKGIELTAFKGLRDKKWLEVLAKQSITKRLRTNGNGVLRVLARLGIPKPINPSS